MLQWRRPEGGVSMKKQSVAVRALRGAVLLLYVPMMLMGPLLAMGGEGDTGVDIPLVQSLAGAAYWACFAFLLVIPASVTGRALLRRRGREGAAWAVLLLPLLWLAGVELMYSAADAMMVGSLEVFTC